MTNLLSEDLISVEFFTQTNLVNGLVRCPAGSRLLDLLNGLISLERGASGEFIEFINASAFNENLNYQEQSKECIRKTAIQLVAISDVNLGRGAGAIRDRNVFPFVRKNPLAVSVELQNYVIIGTAHLDIEQTMRELLNNNTKFLPLTDVTIAQDYHFYGTRPFVAVNKNHIISLKEEQLGYTSGKSYPAYFSR